MHKSFQLTTVIAILLSAHVPAMIVHIMCMVSGFVHCMSATQLKHTMLNYIALSLLLL